MRKFTLFLVSLFLTVGAMAQTPVLELTAPNKDKIFNVNFTTKIHGMGLGLRLVKNVVDQAGGSVDFHSVEGEGSTFIVSFPIHKQ